MLATVQTSHRIAPMGFPIVNDMIDAEKTKRPMHNEYTCQLDTSTLTELPQGRYQ